MAKHALLFAGCYNRDNTAIRYNNDIGFMNEVLQNNNYDHITILYTNGDNIHYNSTQVTTSAATYSSLVNTLNNYAAALDVDDQLLIMITNHGLLDKNQAYIICWDTPFISSGEFNAIVNKIKCKKIIIHGQCKGGNFLEHINNSIIISANRIDEDSYSTPGAQYDEFLYHFTSFYNNGYPNSSLHSPSNDKSIKAAFDYCRNYGTYRNPITEVGKTGKIRIYHEVPQIIYTDLQPGQISI